MDCLHFSKWLENRDMFDVSEADKAIKHSDACENCNAKLQFDEHLDRLLFKAMQPVEIPKSLSDTVDINLDRMSNPKSRKKYGWYGLFSAAAAAMIILIFSFPFSSGIPSMDELGKYVIADHDHHGDAVLVVRNPEDLQQLGDIAMPYSTVKAQLPAQYSFVGARICPLGECQAVHLVYLDKGKRVSVYMVKVKDVAFSMSSGKQYTVSSKEQVVSFWKKGKYIFAKVG